MVAKARVPVEYVFNYHEWCDPEWFWSKELETQKDELITMNIRQKAASVDVAVGATSLDYDTNNDIVLCMHYIDPVEICDSNYTEITSDWSVTNHLDHAKITGGVTCPNCGAVLQSVPGATG